MNNRPLQISFDWLLELETLANRYQVYGIVPDLELMTLIELKAVLNFLRQEGNKHDR